MWTLRWRRWRRSRRGDLPAALTKAWAEPLPDVRGALDDVRFLVCDAEMSGLNPGSAELLSLGWVQVDHLEIMLGSARHRLIRNAESVGSSATFHGLRDCELRDANALEPVMEQFLDAAEGRVLVFHNAALDMAFLDRAAQRLWGAPLLLPRVDTLLLEQRIQQRAERVLAHGNLRLSACRQRYGLDAHEGHHALSDALATAELLLAHIAGRGPGLELRDLL